MSDNLIQIDLHGMKFFQAKTDLLDSLEGYCNSGYTTFEIVHGYRGGQILKTYVRKNLKIDFEKNNPQYSLTLFSLAKGTTKIRISSNKK